jgi:hypothetical protein
MKGDGFMKRKTIDASREARLWIKDIVVPALLFGATVLNIPEVKQAVNEKVKQFKSRKNGSN